MYKPLQALTHSPAHFSTWKARVSFPDYCSSNAGYEFCFSLAIPFTQCIYSCLLSVINAMAKGLRKKRVYYFGVLHVWMNMLLFIQNKSSR